MWANKEIDKTLNVIFQGGMSAALPEAPSAVIFDLDGVLLDTEPLYSLALERTLAPHGASFRSEYKAQVMGLSAYESTRCLLQLAGLALPVEQVLEERKVHLRQLFAQCPAIGGALAWVQKLQRHSIPLCVATSSERSLCELKWGSHPILQNLEHKLCGDDPESGQHKPAPDIYLAAARRLSVPPQRCLVFEDSIPGVTAALAAGAQVTHVRSPFVDPAAVPTVHHQITSFEGLTLQQFRLPG